MSKTEENAQIFAMLQTEGWKVAEQYIKDQVEALKSDLLTTEFTDLSHVARIQGVIEGLNKLPNQLQYRVKRHLDALQKGEQN